MKIINLFLFLGLVFNPICLVAGDLFSKDEPIQNGIDVFKMSDVFSEIYEKLYDANLGGKNSQLSIENLEKLNPHADITLTNSRVVLVWDDKVIGNFPRPDNGDWHSYGQIITALMIRMRENDAGLRSLRDVDLYNTVVKVLLGSIGEKGFYIHPQDEKQDTDAKILTSLGFEGGRDKFGNFRVIGIFKNSPADKAGIKEGDLISEINGERVSNTTDSDLAAVLAGYNSGTVKVKLLAPSGNRYITLRRATVVSADADVIYRTSNEQGKDILEIVVHEVSESAVDIINEALAKYRGVGGIILDLRACGGDDERAAAKLAGLFLGQRNVMVISGGENGDLEVVPGGDAITNAPVVVLISDSTRGMAEAIASAFYENKRGVLIGTPTAGQIRKSSRIPLKNGDVLELFDISIKTGRGAVLDRRGMFPLVCLSSIKNASDRETFFVNVINGQFNSHDYNKDENADVKSLRLACPRISSGVDEDAMAGAVSAQILTNKTVYNELMDL